MARLDKSALDAYELTETRTTVKGVDQKCYQWRDEDGRLVGKFHVWTWWDGTNVSDLEVGENYRGQGYSYALLDAAVKMYGARYLTVKIGNVIAYHVYKKYGFRKVDQDFTYVYMALRE